MEFKSVICSLFTSRRLGGKILSINFSPLKEKACSFICFYCALGKTIKHKPYFSEDECYDIEFVKNELIRGFKHFKESDPDIVAINVAGTGEPTLYYHFYEAAEKLLSLRDELFPDLKVSIFTNMTGSYSERDIYILNKFDTIYCKLDAGCEEGIKKINQPVNGVTFNGIVSNIKKLDSFNLSVSVFEHNIGYLLSSDFIDVIKDISPKCVTLYELDRPKVVSNNKTISFRTEKDKLVEVKNYITNSCGIPVELIYNTVTRGKHNLSCDKKNMYNIAMIGFGNQGKSQALNLRDSGNNVIVVNVNEESKNDAYSEGFEVYSIEKAVDFADILFLLIPDDVLPEYYNKHLKNTLRKNQTVVLASGYNVKYNKIEFPEYINVFLIAPRMIGVGVREYYLQNKKFFCFAGIYQSSFEDAEVQFSKLINSVGTDEKHSIEMSPVAETELDLFTEQCFVPAIKQVIVSSIMFLVEKGYDKNAILIELYKSGELSFVFEKAAEIGLFEQSKFHSLVSQYGSSTRLNTFKRENIINVMEKNFAQIVNGSFAQEFDEAIKNMKFNPSNESKVITAMENALNYRLKENIKC